LGYMIAVRKTAPRPITEEKIRFLAKAEEIEADADCHRRG
jgi:hypothetical protein